jgi:hypothetical protein
MATDRSGVIVAANVPQTFAPTSRLRLGYIIQNNSNGDLWVNDLGTPAAFAPPSFRLVPGASFESILGYRPSQSISIIGATIGQPFTGRVW